MADAGGLNPPDWKRSYGFESRPGHLNASVGLSGLDTNGGCKLALQVQNQVWKSGADTGSTGKGLAGSRKFKARVGHVAW